MKSSTNNMFTRIYRSFHTDDVYCSAFTLKKIKLQKSKITKVKPQVSRRSQYRVWPPTAPMQSLHLPLIDRTRFLKNSCGISFHFCTRTSASSARVSSCGPLWTRRPSSSQACSIGAMSGERAGHGITAMLASSKLATATREVCARALSCWKVSKSWCS